jgi:hypothetical protein
MLLRLLAVAVSWLAAAAPAHAAIALVNSPLDAGNGTLRAALASLPASGDHFVIFNLPPDATINIQSPLPPIRGTSVFFDGLGAPGLTVRAAQPTRVFLIDASAPPQSLTMRLFRVADGVGPAGGCLYDPSARGPAATIVLDRMVFDGCRATGSNFNLGGAVRTSTALQVLDSTFIDNVATNADGVSTQRNDGGAIYASGPLVVSGSRFVGNESRGNPGIVAGTGSAIFATRTLSISRSHFEGNRVIEGGFAIPGAAYCALTTACSVVASSFRGNLNGALVIDAQDATVANTSFIDTIGQPSLQVFPREGRITLRNLSFLRHPGAGASSPAHLAINAFLSSNPDVVVANSVFGSTAGVGDACQTSPPTFTGNGGGYLLAVDASCDALASGGAAIVADAGLLDPVDAEGAAPVQVLPLAFDSPARDAGNPAPPGDDPASCVATDARGLARPQDGDADGVPACDIGAWEAPAERLFGDGFEG